MGSTKLSPMFTELSGSIGPHTYFKARSGLAVRERVTPRNDRTTRELAARNRMTTVSQAWSDKTESMRLAWNAAAALYIATNHVGEPMLLSGHQLWCAVQTLRLVAGLTEDTTTPTARKAALVPTLASVAATNVSIASISNAADYDGADVIVAQCSHKQSVGRYAFPASPFHAIAHETVTLMATTPLVLLLNATSPIALYDKWFVRSYVIPATGNNISLLYHGSIVTQAT